MVLLLISLSVEYKGLAWYDRERMEDFIFGFKFFRKDGPGPMPQNPLPTPFPTTVECVC
jgi:hypothetical protein